jgi:hypothetical protein
MVKAANNHLPPRLISFVGDHKDHSIIIGNFGDAKVVVQGNFDLSGLVYCPKSTLEINVEGNGKLIFTGSCKRLFIRGVRGNCVLDLSDLTAKSIWCESIKDQATVMLGPTRTIELISAGNKAVVYYEQDSQLQNYAVRDDARIVPAEKKKSAASGAS